MLLDLTKFKLVTISRACALVGVLLLAGCGSEDQATGGSVAASKLVSIEPITAVKTSTVGYTITDLGLGAAEGINDSGQVVGVFNAHAVIWNNGTSTDIGTLDQANGDYSNAKSINDAGQVLVNVSIHGSDYIPFIWTNGNMAQLSPFGLGAFGYALNNSVQAVGFSIAGNSAWSYNVNLAYGGYGSSAFDINDGGQAVGYVMQGRSIASLWNNGLMTTLDGLTAAFAINNKGDVVGITANGDVALMSNGALTVIGPSNGLNFGKIFDINDFGQVVGSGFPAPYLWDNVVLTDLNNLVAGEGWILKSATAINNKGQIVGNGTINGESHAFIMTPQATFDSLSTLAVQYVLATGAPGRHRVANALAFQLSNAAKAAERGNDKEKINRLGAFISTVSHLDRFLTQAQMDELIAIATMLLGAGPHPAENFPKAGSGHRPPYHENSPFAPQGEASKEGRYGGNKPKKDF